MSRRARLLLEEEVIIYIFLYITIYTHIYYKLYTPTTVHAHTIAYSTVYTRAHIVKRVHTPPFLGEAPSPRPGKKVTPRTRHM